MLFLLRRKCIGFTKLKASGCNLAIKTLASFNSLLWLGGDGILSLLLKIRRDLGCTRRKVSRLLSPLFYQDLFSSTGLVSFSFITRDCFPVISAEDLSCLARNVSMDEVKSALFSVISVFLSYHLKLFYIKFCDISAK